MAHDIEKSSGCVFTDLGLARPTDAELAKRKAPMAHDAEKLRELLERVEKASGPDREIDVAIARHFGTLGHAAGMSDEGLVGLASSARRYTGSIDASIALGERMLPRWEMDISIMPLGNSYVDMRGPDFCDADMRHWSQSKVMKTPLATLSALLRALIAQAEGEGADA